jgi:ribosomal protein S17E
MNAIRDANEENSRKAKDLAKIKSKKVRVFFFFF